MMNENVVNLIIEQKNPVAENTDSSKNDQCVSAGVSDPPKVISRLPCLDPKLAESFIPKYITKKLSNRCGFYIEGIPKLLQNVPFEPYIREDDEMYDNVLASLAFFHAAHRVIVARKRWSLNEAEVKTLTYHWDKVAEYLKYYRNLCQEKPMRLPSLNEEQKKKFAACESCKRRIHHFGSVDKQLRNIHQVLELKPLEEKTSSDEKFQECADSFKFFKEAAVLLNKRKYLDLNLKEMDVLAFHYEIIKKHYKDLELIEVYRQNTSITKYIKVTLTLPPP